MEYLQYSLSGTIEDLNVLVLNLVINGIPSIPMERLGMDDQLIKF